MAVEKIDECSEMISREVLTSNRRQGLANGIRADKRYLTCSEPLYSNISFITCSVPPSLSSGSLAGEAEEGQRRDAECAGINRHVVGDERALQERSSDSILTSSLARYAARRTAKRR